MAAAYYQVLRVRSLRRIAVESVRRATDDLDVARKLAKGGVIEREKVLRAEVALAQAQRALDVAEEADGVAVAALNLAIGLNVSAVTEVKDTGDIPPFTKGLADCLQVAVGERREFQVARKSVQVAQEGSRVARADFAPRIVAEGSLVDYQQSSPRATPIWAWDSLSSNGRCLKEASGSPSCASMTRRSAKRWLRRIRSPTRLPSR